MKEKKPIVSSPKDNTNFPILEEKRLLLLYSFYLGLGSVALFIFITGVNTTYQAIIWKYTSKYIVNSAVLTLVALTAGVLLVGACWLLLKSNPIVKSAGFLGCCLLIIYPFSVYLLDLMMPYSFVYLLLLCIPAAVALILSFRVWKKQ